MSARAGMLLAMNVTTRAPERDNATPLVSGAVRFHDVSEGLLRWAWIYLVEPERVQGLPVIPGGDWLAR